MKVTKFKPLDIVENIHIGEIEMVSSVYDNVFSNVILLHNDRVWYGMRRTADYRKLSYKDVKINLNTKNN